MRRFGRSALDWLAPAVILVLGFAPLFLTEVGDGGRWLSVFPTTLEPGWLAWRPVDSWTILLAGLAVPGLAWVTWKSKAILVNAWPVAALCVLLSPAITLAATAFGRNGGEALYVDRAVFRDPAPWSSPVVIPLSEVRAIETGCLFYKRYPVSIFNIVFSDGHRISLGSASAINFGLSQEPHLELVRQVDALPALRHARRIGRRDPFGGGELNAPGCVEMLAAKYPVERQQTVIHLFSARP